ncbi:hypothetical protein MPSEU_000239700 [Mayamaea pseudoterrestris]|nr:hypothetical protein MPSEU_000239700 [Mayamaea pseudoterrestris]
MNMSLYGIFSRFNDRESGFAPGETSDFQSLGLTEEQYTKLDQLCSLVLDWNQKINLVSRQHAEPSVVWEKHILPSLAALACLREHTKDNGDSLTMKIIDVGTGGGFPGLPLAIACPESRFCLLDSVGKKLIAVQNMAEQLELTNVQTHHGRAEAYTGLLEQNGSHSLFDVATSRSVSALPNVCTWMHHLLEPKTGELLYWIGDSETEVAKDASLNDIVRVDAVVPGLKSDKSIWTLRQAQVSAIAKKSGIKMERNWQSKQPDATTSATASWSEKKGNRISPSKGAWKRKDPSAPKDRGYEGFQRYNSLEN